MELLISAVISLVTSFLRLLTKKFGVKMSRSIVIATVFLLSFVYVALTNTGVITPEIVKMASLYFLQAVGMYEFVYKKILIPSFFSEKKKKKEEEEDGRNGS